MWNVYSTKDGVRTHIGTYGDYYKAAEAQRFAQIEQHGGILNVEIFQADEDPYAEGDQHVGDQAH